MVMRAQQSRQYRKGRGRMPGINFDTFEPEPEHEVANYGVDRAPTYQSRYAASRPQRYARRIARWLAGSKSQPRRQRRRSTRQRRRARRSIH
jgi:hypothetical protein